MASGSRTALAAVLIACAGGAVAPVRADVLDDIGKKLVTVEGEARELGSGIKKPTGQPKKDDVMSRRLIDAQVAFGVGNYDNAALLLYDYVAQATRGRDYDTALYYLGEALFQKKDRVASRTYFTQLVKELPSSKYYQQSLERLIELSLILGDTDGVDAWLADLDRVPSDKRRPSVPYVRGKYAFAQNDFAGAEGWFKQVPADSEYGFQAQYYLGTAYVGMRELGKATQAMAALLDREPKTDDDARVKELAQLALGRLYYERDQPTKAIDSYLLLDRKSDLFPDALYEVAWVYVKSQQYDKALRALELLALADPTSQRLPTVRILEGNLRVRKAQGIHEKVLAGLDTGSASGTEEYDKATRLFGETHELYAPPHDELAKIIAANEDPQAFLAQITGRASETFHTNSTMPEIAAAWIRDEPNVNRVMTVETDLGDIQGEINEAERTIQRLDAVLGSANRVNIFPSLATKRSRSTELLEDLLGMREKLADEEYRLAQQGNANAQLAAVEPLTQRRRALLTQWKAMPDAAISYGQRVEKAQGQFDDVDRQLAEVLVTIDTTQATVVALDKFVKESAEPSDPAAKKAWIAQKLEAQKVIAELNIEMAEMHQELDGIRREVVLGRDEAGSGDEVSLRARTLRDQLRAAYADEHRAVARLTLADAKRGGKIGDLIRRSDAAMGQLDTVNDTIDQIVEVALTEVQDTLTYEKAELASYRREFLLYEAESRALGGTVLGNAFRDVKAKFYDVLVRSDVGVVDVGWSQKEESDEDLSRLNVEKQREIKQLRDEFADLIREAKEDAPAPAPEPAPPPPDGATPGGLP
ncbi:MAG: tetratricopeptide repeat protein [Myxococcales bacterium]|nr:tetratricopeptide repeat protein [Myxococcales bacterium]MBK7192387.1 tetratricopeptide repeat protein [Myxococcales bacterium]MBP6842397.1 tetratricopeptide repeat protein [Kofleriaceae bacterium]